MRVLDTTMDRKQTDSPPKKSSLDDLLRQTLASLYQRELEINLLIDYLKTTRNKKRLLEDDVQGQEPNPAGEDLMSGEGRDESVIRNWFDWAFGDRPAEQHLHGEELEEAIPNRGFSLVFEPIVSSAGECRMVEALLRWAHPKHGQVSPYKFISLAERTGDIVPIGRWALIEACREAQTWPGTPAPAVSVNVSPVQILRGSFEKDVSDALAASGLPPDRLQIELTESLLASDLRSLASVLADLRKAGIRVALDDFGTGFSSLSYLRTLLIDRIKIDRSFVEPGDTSIPILKAIISMAQAL
jgi:EAL domain-containing protein (putative c-di-GMP-specific phosphodiesterase class I)